MKLYESSCATRAFLLYPLSPSLGFLKLFSVIKSICCPGHRYWRWAISGDKVTNGTFSFLLLMDCNREILNQGYASSPQRCQSSVNTLMTKTVMWSNCKKNPCFLQRGLGNPDGFWSFLFGNWDKQKNKCSINKQMFHYDCLKHHKSQNAAVVSFNLHYFLSHIVCHTICHTS